MRKIAMIALATLAGAISCAAIAQAPGRDARAEVDRAGMTRDAVQRRSEAAFDRLDRDKNGKLDAADREERLRARFDKADADGDGAISYDELAGLREARREKLVERRPARAELAGSDARSNVLGRRMDDRPRLRGASQPARGMGAMMRLGAMDVDGDHTVTRAEFSAAAMERFDAVDRDADENITREERRSARNAERRARPSPVD